MRLPKVSKDKLLPIFSLADQCSILWRGRIGVWVFVLNHVSWKHMGVYSELLPLMPWCLNTRPSDSTVPTKYSSFEPVFIQKYYSYIVTLHWHHNDHNNVSNHQPHGCLLNRLFRRRSKKTSKLWVTGLCVGNSPGLVNSPHKGPVMRKMFLFDDVIMN